MRSHALAPYRAIFSSSTREELHYHAAALAGLFTHVVFGFILIMVLLAFYASSEAISPLSIPETVAYPWIGQALLGLMPWNVESGRVGQRPLRTVVWRPLSSL